MRRLSCLIAICLTAVLTWPASPRGQRGTTYTDDLKTALERGDAVRVIVQGDLAAPGLLRGGLLRGLRRQLSQSLALDLSGGDLRQLVASGAPVHLSRDLIVGPDMAVTNQTTGADRVWAGSPGLLGLGGTRGANGRGVGVAVIDSGIAADHPAVAGRVIARVNFVADEPTVVGDPFGHGTHVAGIIGGTAAAASRVTSAYAGGSAPGVHFVDVRVLNRAGRGYTSDVIAGIEWAVANRRRLDIDVINLSLGHPVAEPAATDPLVAAVSRAVDAGVVVVVSAGNDGETAEGVPVLGGITSPGNAPTALTVGALDTRGTGDRRDDRVASFSSRGPTRFDFAVKPDMVAPGAGLVSLESPGSYIVTRFPSAHYAGRGANAYVRLSGTSMAAGVVTGGVALLLQANPTLSPAQVKLALQMGATYLPEAGLVGGGAGSVDFTASQSLAGGTVPRLLTSLTGPLLQGPTAMAYRDSGQLVERLYAGTGIRLLGVDALAWLLSHADDAENDTLDLLGLRNPLQQVAPNYLVWGSAAGWSDSYYIVWGSAMRSPRGDYIVWGSGRQSDYIVWGSMHPQSR